MLLKNTTVLVTGASRGIGREIALTLAHDGAGVILLARHEKTLIKVKREIEETGSKAEIAVCDLCNEQQIYSISESIQKKFGCIDALINIAGIFVAGSFLGTSMQDIDAQMLVDVRAPMLLMRSFLPGMLENGRGTIVNIASCAGVRGCPNALANAMAKAAIISLSNSTGEEYRRQGVSVNCISPGPVDTDSFNNTSLRDYEMQWGGDVIEPSTVANTVLFLVSDLAKAVTCQNLIVRGASRW